MLPFKGDPSLLRPASKAFHCHEYLERHETIFNEDDSCAEDVNVRDDDEEEDDYYVSFDEVVMFQCTLPEKKKSLTFQCLEPSCGVLIEEETAAEKEEDGAMDPFFFDTGYTLAGKTGFQVWPGSRLVVEAMTFADPDHDSPQLKAWQERMANGVRVLELGSGDGVVGASLASFGAEVLLSDLKTLVQNSTQPNLQRNANQQQQPSGDTTPAVSVYGRSHHSDYDESNAPASPLWLPKNTVRIGKGWAGTTAVDWTVPLPDQVQHNSVSFAAKKKSLNDESSSPSSLEPSSILGQVEVVIASDCVWLVSMMEPLFDTVQYVFQHNPKAKLLLSFQRRDGTTNKSTSGSNNTKDETSMFTTVDKILTTIQQDRKWSVQCLTWRYVNQSDKNEIFLFEVSPNQDETE